MKRALKNTIKAVVPGLAETRRLIQQTNQKVTRLETGLTDIHNKLSDTLERDDRLTQLKKKIANVEHYQPIYHITGIVDTPMRSSFDRCVAIEDAIGPVAGQRLLDLGSSLGYVSFYMADRGAKVQGWEENVNNAEVARLVGQLNGIGVDFRTKEFNDETVGTIPRYEFDVAILLSVAHHIIRFNGVEYTQKLIKNLLERVPVLVAELARKGEDPKLPWDSAQPENELAIFDLIKDEVTIEKIGDFGNHLSSKTRPLYVIRKKQVLIVNNHNYVYDRKSNVAYTGSPVAYHGVQRRYYHHKQYVIKEYLLKEGEAKDTAGQILNEIQSLINLSQQNVHNLPELIDYEIGPERAVIVVKRVPGFLLSELEAPLTTTEVIGVVGDILHTLADLHKLGLSHNDVRAWNIIVSGTAKKTGHLIDYGLVSGIRKEDDVLNALYLINESQNGDSARNNRPQKYSELISSLPLSWKTRLKRLETGKATLSAEQALAALEKK